MLNIVGFVKKLLPFFETSDVLSDLEVSIKNIDISIDSFESLKNTVKVAKFTAEKNTQLHDIFYKEVKEVNPKIKLAPLQNFVEDNLTLLKNAKENGKYIHDELESAFNDVMVSSSLTTYKASLIRSVAHYYFIGKYTLDLLNYLYVNETLTINSDLSSHYKLNKKQTSNIENNMWIYARLLSVYGLPREKFKKQLDSILDVQLPTDKLDEISSMYASSNIDILSNLPSGFVGSPIYSIRLIFATWQADRYRNLKDKKKLLELRLMHYRLLKEQGESDVAVEKEIEYLQKRVTDLDYKIAKYEEDAND